jgi:ABC-type sugar transport system permease subunit
VSPGTARRDGAATTDAAPAAARTSAAAAPEPRRRRPAARRRFNGLAVIAALAAGLYLLFIVVPLGLSIGSSLTDESPLGAASSFVGLHNYADLLHDGDLGHSLGFTLVLAAVVTVAANVLGLLLAMLLDRSSLPYRLMRTVAFLPQVVSGVIVGFVWRSIMTQNGLANTLLTSAGLIDEPISWLGSPAMASASIAIVMTWVLSGFTTVVYLAALQSIPPELYEAARVDGAGAVRRFRAITLPMVAPGTTIGVTLSLITVLKLYDVITVLTAGGPANATRSTALYVVQVAFTENRFGYASAVAIVLLLVSAVIAVSVTGLLRRREVSL